MNEEIMDREEAAIEAIGACIEDLELPFDELSEEVQARLLNVMVYMFKSGMAFTALKYDLPFDEVMGEGDSEPRVH